MSKCIGPLLLPLPLPPVLLLGYDALSLVPGSVVVREQRSKALELSAFLLAGST